LLKFLDSKFVIISLSLMKITKKLYKNIHYCIRCGTKILIKNDNENKIRPICPNCNWIYYLNPIPVVACVILNQKKQLLIIKRRFEPSPDSWALPSGYIEINQTPQEAAIAEMSEETNLLGKKKEFLGHFVGYSPIYHRVIAFGYLMKILSGDPRAGDDAKDLKFVNLDQKFDFIPFDSHIHFINRVKKILL